MALVSRRAVELAWSRNGLVAGMARSKTGNLGKCEVYGAIWGAVVVVNTRG